MAGQQAGNDIRVAFDTGAYVEGRMNEIHGSGEPNPAANGTPPASEPTVAANGAPPATANETPSATANEKTKESPIPAPNKPNNPKDSNDYVSIA